MDSRTMNVVKRVAFVAHEERKTDLIEWSYFNKALLAQHEIIALGEAGNILEGTLNKPVCKLLSGSFGGYQKLGAMIAEGKVDAIIFFWKEMETHINHNGISDLLRIALAANIIIACNKTTADFVLTSDLMTKEHSLPGSGDTTYSPNKVYQKNSKSKLPARLSL